MNPLTIVVYVALVALVLYRVMYRQLRGTLLSRKSLMTLPLVLTAVGVFNIVGALPKASAGELALLGADVVVLVVLGLARSASSTLERRGTTTFQKGSALTVILWLTTIVVRIGFSVLGAVMGIGTSLTSASIMLTLGLSIGVQNALTYYRIQQRGLPLADRREAVRA
ncbi:MAG TPA: hypothetical protein VG674_07415 [Amycolatopsis sp.]|jgi:hypothetical protein|nr:hypothetical protein [Amycolatopsis sp.]